MWKGLPLKNYVKECSKDGMLSTGWHLKIEECQVIGKGGHKSVEDRCRELMN